MTDSDQPLEATRFQPQAPIANAPSAPDGTAAPRWLLPAIGVTSLLLAVVVFVLPEIIESNPKTDALDTRITSAESRGTGNPAITEPNTDISTVDAGLERSPFAEAQLQKQRRAAQEALQRVLELQEMLQDLQVGVWAAEAYQSAIAVAEAGDEAYRARDFEHASTLYLKAGEALLELEASIPRRIAAIQNSLVAAIEAGESVSAQGALNTLQLLAPNEVSTAQFAARVTAIPTVMAAMAAAKAAFDQESYAQAVSEIEAAVAADAQHQGAKAVLEVYRREERAANFRAAMGEGYDALDEGAFQKARQAFLRADTLRPGAPEIAIARTELENAETRATLVQLQDRARQLERAEDWQGALDSYQEAQNIDASLVFAKDGIARSKPRLALATALTEIVEASERLVDTRLLAQARETLAQAKAIPDPGARLIAQIKEAELAIQYASTPVSVTLTSDGLTDITVLRVRRLGPFSETALTLRPGQYTAMGVRNGFRDVRVNFEVTPDNTGVVDVRCVESI